MEFYHELHGSAILLPNTKLKVSENPTSICWRAFGETEINVSSLKDAGLEGISKSYLKELGY